jgi:hypothetical protein
MDRAVVAAGNEKISGAIECQAAGIHQRSDKRLHAVIRGDFIERDGNALAARAGERDVDVSVEIDRRIRHRMQIVRDLQADVHGMGRALVAGCGHADDSAACPFRNARDQPGFTGEREAGLRFAKAYHWP